MKGSLHFGLLAVVGGQALAQSTDVITDDAYFYGQSPSSYPSPNATGSGAWADAYAKARALVGQLTVEEKVHTSSNVPGTRSSSLKQNIGRKNQRLLTATT